MIGRILSNRYKLIGELGSGGMAWVYLAADLVEEHTVAVKILYPQNSQDLGFVQRFIREARLSMTLSQPVPHPNIVRVLDYGADRDTHYLVMEYVPGKDLGQILEERGPLLWQLALGLARQVALALDHAHHHEVVHRDIKPSNIMILPDGTVRVLDFGIARARTSPELTLSGFVGSPSYAAPEQATKQPVDIRADIYSLGVVLYRMLSGGLPFEGETPWEVVNQHISATPPSLDARCPGLPRQVVRLVEKAMAKSPRGRFKTPAEMVQAIDAVLAGQELPQGVLTPDPDGGTQMDELYLAAEQAIAAERWQEAVDLLSRIVKLEPDYRDVTDLLGEVGQQIRLANLYRSAQRSLESGQWDQALAQLNKIVETTPCYKDVANLQDRARRKEMLPAGAAPASEFPTQVPVEEAASPPPPMVATAQRPARRIAWPWLALGLLVLIGGLLALFLWPNDGNAPPTLPAAGPSATVTASGISHAEVATASVTASKPAPSATPRPSATRVVPQSSPTARATSTQTATRAPADTTAPATATETPSATPAATVTATREPRLAGQIAFPRFDPGRGTYDVLVCPADQTAGSSSTCRLLASEASQPDFLPDGSQFVYHSWKPNDEGLILANIDGQRVWRITSDLEAARPSVDARGELYVYHSRHEADRQPRLYRTYDAETRPLYNGANVILGRSPSWTPRGQILYSGCLGDTCGILLLGADGGQPRQITAGTTEMNAEASPDGRSLAFMSQRDGNWEVYVASLAGDELKRITNDPASDGLPTWSPDGRYLAFVSDRGGSWAVWVVRADGSGLRRLFAVGGSLDGRVQSAVAYQTHGWVEERISWGPTP